MPITADVCVIGSGPGGYVCAIRASRLGLKTVIVEQGDIGGVCTNTGCIPTKALLRSAEVYQLASSAETYGVRANGVTADLPAMAERKDKVVSTLSRGVGALLASAGVDVIPGRARLAGGGVVEVDLTKGGSDLVTARNIVISTGSSPAVPPVPGFDLAGVMTSEDALKLKQVPGSMTIVGGGAVGVEWASFFSTLGSQVTLVEMLDRVVPVEDEEISAALEREFTRHGIAVRVSTAVKAISGSPGEFSVTVSSPDGGDDEIKTETILNATGRSANTRDIGLETVGVKFGRTGIDVDLHLRTSVAGIYAIGDVTGIKLLAHLASHQGIVAAENMAGNETEIDYSAVPGATFCMPEIASVGLSEAAACEKFGDALVGKFPYMASGRARAYGEPEGFLKVVAGPQYGEVVGMHIIGAGASDVIAEGVLAIKLEATLDDLRDVIHAHPTFSELVGEAAWEAIGEPINTLRSR
jgi:dihydrolipoamide dehydrogenase